MSQQKTDAPARLPYKPPRMMKLGTLRDLTGTVGSTGNADGGNKKGQNKTR